MGSHYGIEINASTKLPVGHCLTIEQEIAVSEVVAGAIQQLRKFIREETVAGNAVMFEKAGVRCSDQGVVTCWINARVV